MAATALLAAGAYGAGALPGGDPGADLRRLGLAATPVSFQVGLAACAAGTVALVVVWWRLGVAIRAGEESGEHRLSQRWLAVTGGLWALPLLFAPPLASRDVYSYACQGWLHAGGLDPYAVTASAGACPWLDSVAPVWRDSPTPYGPVAVALSTAAVWLGGQLLPTVGVLRAVALAGGVLIAVAVPRLARACGVPPVPAAWLGLCTPLAAVHVVAGAHHDALVAGLVVAGLAAAATARRAPWAVLAGVALGLAVAIKITAIVAVPFAVLLVAGRGPRRWAGVAMVGAAGGVFAAVTLATGLGFGWVGAMSGTVQQTQWTSVPTGVGMGVGYLLRGFGVPGAAEPAVTVARLAGLAALAGVALALWVRSWRRRHDVRTVVACCGAAFAAVAALSPVFYPWYAVTALAVLAVSATDDRVRRRLAMVTVALTFLVLPNGLGVAALTKLPGALLDVALVAAVAWVGLRRLIGRYSGSGSARRSFASRSTRLGTKSRMGASA